MTLIDWPHLIKTQQARDCRSSSSAGHQKSSLFFRVGFVVRARCWRHRVPPLPLPAAARGTAAKRIRRQSTDPICLHTPQSNRRTGAARRPLCPLCDNRRRPDRSSASKSSPRVYEVLRRFCDCASCEGHAGASLPRRGTSGEITTCQCHTLNHACCACTRLEHAVHKRAARGSIDHIVYSCRYIHRLTDHRIQPSERGRAWRCRWAADGGPAASLLDRSGRRSPASAMATAVEWRQTRGFRQQR